MLNGFDVQLKRIKRNANPFGGIQIVFLGDFYQLHPINNMPWFREYENVPLNEGNSAVARACKAGRNAWLTVIVAFEPDVNYRQQADTTGFIDTLRTACFRVASKKAQLARLRARECSLSNAFERAGDDALWVTHKHETSAAINDADLVRSNAKGARTVHVWAQHLRKATKSALTIDGQLASLSHHECKRLTDHNTGVLNLKFSLSRRVEKKRFLPTRYRSTSHQASLSYENPIAHRFSAGVHTRLSVGCITHPCIPSGLDFFVGDLAGLFDCSRRYPSLPVVVKFFS